MISDKEMKIFEKILKKDNKEKNIIKRHVKVLTIQDLETGDIEVKYEFGFDFINDDNKKKALVWIDKEKVILDNGQYCIFELESENIEPFRIKAMPDFKSEGCGTTACFDQNIKDSDI